MKLLLLVLLKYILTRIYLIISGRHKDQTTPQTVTIRRSTRLLSDSKNREGSAYFTLSTT